MAFWADSVNGRVLYRETTNRALLRKASQDIYKAFPDHFLAGMKLSWMFIVTWKDVPFYGNSASCNGNSKRNTYQLILTSDGTHSFALIYYTKIQWTTGTASSGDCNGLFGSPAKAGFDYGDQQTWYTIPGSCQNSVLNITETSNVGDPGKWVFRIDSNLKIAECQEFDGESQKLRLDPSVVSVMGNVPLKLTGPCLTPNDTVVCVYNEESNETEVEGVVTPDSKAVVCPMPFFNLLERKTVTLKITRSIIGSSNEITQKEKSYQGYLYVVNEDYTVFGDDSSQIKVSFNQSEIDNDTSILIDVQWNPSFVDREIGLIFGEERAPRRKRSVHGQSLDLILESYDGLKWRELGVMQESIANSGSFRGSIDRQLIQDIIDMQKPELMTVSLARSKKRRAGEINWSKKIANALSTSVSLYETLSRVYPLARMFAGTNALMCSAWSLLSDPPPTDTRPCPPSRQLAEVDKNFEVDEAMNWMPFFHPGGSYIVRQKVASDSGAGSQCVYDDSGTIMVGPPGGGTLDRYSPNKYPVKHVLHDVLPYVICCKLSGFLNDMNCKHNYYRRRPSDGGSNYPRPRPARAVGDPHITTFDGLFYTFNGVGEFWMVKMEDNVKNIDFKMQARMEQYVSSEGIPMNASVFTAVVMEEVKNEEIITVQVSYNDEKILVSLDGEAIDVNYTSVLVVRHKTAQVTINSAEDVEVTFSSGFSFTFSTVGPNEVAMNIEGLADEGLRNLGSGLMGDCDGNPENDLKLTNGTILSSNSTPSEIHYNFGLKWMVKQHESFFTYPPGKGYSDYSKPEFQPKFLLDSDLESINQSIVDTCEGSKYCIFDYLTTGSQAVANGTKSSNIAFNRVVQVASQKIKLCPSVNHPENGYASVNNLLIGGKLKFLCDKDYHLEETSAKNCTCSADMTDNDQLNWICNDESPFPTRCVSNAVVKSCDEPPSPRNGYIVGDNYAVGSTIELRCTNENFDLFWKNCQFNGLEHMGLCKEHCNVTYTCVTEEIFLDDGTSQIQATWQGYAGDISEVVCNSKFVGGISTVLRTTAVLIHQSTQKKLVPDYVEKKPHLIGC